jgi:hypothetical protein
VEPEDVKLILERLGLVFPNHEEFVRDLARTIGKRCGHPIYPEPGESLALSIMKPKTAALAFERVYRIPVAEDPMPEEIGFCCASRNEMIFMCVGLLGWGVKEAGIDLPIFDLEPINAAECERYNLRSLSAPLERFWAGFPQSSMRTQRTERKTSRRVRNGS